MPSLAYCQLSDVATYSYTTYELTFADSRMAGMKQAKVSGEPQRQQTMHMQTLMANIRSAAACEGLPPRLPRPSSLIPLPHV